MNEHDDKARRDSREVVFRAPAELVDRLDRLAARELMTRSTLLRRLAASATQDDVVAA